MKFFENIFKNRFKDAGNLEGIDSDNIWKGIENTLPKATPAVSTSASAGLGISSFLVVMAWLVSVAGLVFLLTTTNAEQKTYEVDKIEEETTNNETTQKSNAETITLRRKAEEEELTKSKKESILQRGTSNSNPRVKRQEKESTNPKENLNYEIKTKENNSQTAQKLTAETIPLWRGTKGVEYTKGEKKPTQSSLQNYSSKNTSQETSNGNSLSQKTAENISKSNNEIKDKATINQTAQKPSTETIPLQRGTKGVKSPPILKKEPLFLTTENSIAGLSSQANSITPIKKKVKKDRFKIGAFAGVNLQSTTYQQGSEPSNFHNTLNETLKGQIGYQTSARVYWKAYKSIDVVTGFDYMNTQSKFKHSITFDTAIVRVGLPGIDTTRGQAIRNINHLNQHTFVSIPILIGTSKQFGKFGFGANIGAGFNFFVSQKGKSMPEENVISSFDNTDDLPFKKNFISYQVNPYFNYWATDKIHLQIQSTFRYQNHGMSDYYDLKQNSIFSGLSLGVLFIP